MILLISFKMYQTVLLLLLCVIYNVKTILTQDNSFREPNSCNMRDGLNYSTDFIYKYDYIAEIATSLVGVDDKSAVIRLTVTLNLQILSTCQLDLTITQASIDGIDQAQKQQLESELEKNSIQFDLTRNGKVKNVYTKPTQSTKVKNLMKGIVSLLQTSNTLNTGRKRINRDDVDIFGDCPTRFTIQPGWKRTFVNREKNLKHCIKNKVTNRPSTHRPHSLPLVRSSQKCKQVLTNVVERVDCVEKHILRPFSGGQGSGVVTNINQKLYLLHRESISSKTPTVFNTKITSLNMEQSNQMPAAQTYNSLIESQQLIQELCKHTKRGVSPSTLSAFEKLSKLFESYTVDQLRQVLDTAQTLCPDNPRIDIILLDALIGVHSAASVSLIASLVSQNALEPSIRDSWFNSFGFRQHVDRQQIAALKPLFTSSMSKQARLAVSTFVFIYCRSNSTCIHDIHIQQFLSILQQQLINQCAPFDDTEGDQILIALKSLGNMGLGSANKLTKCAINSQAPIYLRVATIEAFRRYSCFESRQKIFELFENRDNPSELRIAAYLESMRCPTPSIIRSVERILSSETVNQVGSFVWTHLTNIRESSDECKAPLQSLLSSIDLQTKFSTDARKFSRFFETSFYSELLDTGIHTESAIVFPTDSYLPRSLMINFTTDIFGQPTNLFDFSIRAEGLESLVETHFGPKGLFPNKTPPGSSSTNYKGRVDQEKLQRISRQEFSKSRFNRQPRAISSIKFLGNEMYLWSSAGDQLVTSLSQAFDLRHHLTRLADERHIRITRNSKLVDNSLKYPTGTGLALEASIQSFAALELNAAGRIDFRNIATSGSAHVEGHVHPSVALRLVTGFRIEGIGLALQTTFHSTAVIEGRFEMRAGQLFRIRINVPNDKIFTANIQHQVMLFDTDGEHQIEGITENRQESHYCTDSLTSRPLGVQFCGHISYPNASQEPSAPHFPLTGPARVQLSIEKTDPTLVTFLFEYRWEKEKLIQSTDHLHTFLFSLKTPRSSIDREITAEFVHNQRDKHVTFRLLTPIKKITLIGNYVNELNQKKLDATVTVDRDKYLVQSEWRRESYADIVRIIPNLYIRTPSSLICSLSGSIVLQGDKKLTIHLQIEHLSEQMITLKGDVVKSERHPIRLDWNIAFDSSFLKTIVIGSYQVDADAFVVTCTARYSWRGSERQQLIELLTKVRKNTLPNQRLSRLTCTSHLQFTAFPQYDTLINWVFLSAQGHVENTVQLGLGENAQQTHHQMILEQIFSYSGTVKRNNLTMLLTFSYPVKNLQMGLSVHHSNQARALNSRIILRTSSSHAISITLNVTDLTTTLANVDYRFLLEMPNRNALISANLNEHHPRQYIFNCTATWNPDKRVTLTADYINKSHRKQLYHTIHANLTTINKNLWHWDCDVIAKENHMHLANALLTPNNNKYHALANLTRLEFAKFWFFTQLSWPQTEYTADANLTTGDEKILQTQISLAPNTQIKTYAATKMYDDLLTLDLDFMWDAKRNQSQRVSFAGQYRKLNPEKTKATIDFKYPGRNISVQMLKTQRGNWAFGPLSYEAAMFLQWSVKEKISLDINAHKTVQGYRQEKRFDTHLQTPFDNFESSRVTVTTVDDAVEWQRQIFVQNKDRFRLGVNAKLTEILDSIRSEASILWRSNVEDWEKIDLGGWYVRGQNHVTSQMILEWDQDRKITLKVDANDQSTSQLGRVDGGFNLTSPWFTDTTLAARLHHARHGTFVDSWFDVRWASSNNFRIHVLTNDYHDGKRFSLIINTPIDKYEEIGLQANYTIDRNSFSIDAAFKWHERTNTRIHIHACAISEDQHTNNVTAKFVITTPYSFFDVLGTELIWKHDKHRTKFVVDFQWPTSKRFRIDGTTQKINRVGNEKRIQIQTPWNGYQRFGAIVSYKITNNRINCSAIIDKEGPLIDCRFTHNVNKNSAQTALVLQTSYDAIRLKISTHDKKNGSVSRKGEMQLDKRQIRASFDIDTDDLLNWKANIDLTVNKSRLINIDVHQLSDESDWNHETRIEWKENPFLHLILNRATNGTTKGHLCLSTFVDDRNMSTCEDDQNKIIDLRIETLQTDKHTEYVVHVDHPRWPFRASVLMSDEGLNSTRFRGSIMWENENQTVIAQFDTIWFDSTTGKSLRVILIHPIYRTIIFNCSYNKNEFSFDHRLQLVLEEKKKIGYEISTQVSSVGDEKIHRATLALIHMLRTVQLQGSLTKDKKSTRAKIGLNWDSQRSSDKVVIVRAESENPYDGHFRALIGFQHPKLNHEFITSGYLSYANGTELFSAQLFANYSREPRDLLSVFVRVTNSSNDNENDFAAVAGIVHNTSGINSQIRARGKQTSTTTQLVSSLKYKDRHQDSHEKQISVKLDTTKKQIQIQTSNDEANRTFVARINNTQTQYDVYVNQDKRFNIVHVSVDKEHWRSRLTIAKNSYSQYEIVCGFDDNVRFVGITAVANDTYDHDINARLELETPYLVVWEILWKIDILSEIKSFINEKTMQFVGRIQTNWNEISDELDEEINDKTEIVSENIYDFLRPITDHLRTNLQQMRTEMRQIASQLLSSYDINIFFIKDAVDWLNIRCGEMFASMTESVTKSWEEIIGELKRIHNSITEAWWDWKEKMSDTIDRWSISTDKWTKSRLRDIELFLINFRTQWNSHLVQLFRMAKTTMIAWYHRLKNATSVIAETARSIWNSLVHVGSKISDAWSNFKFFITDHWNEFRTRFIQSELYVTVRAWIIQTYNVIQRIWKHEIYEPIMERVRTVIRIISEHPLIVTIRKAICKLWNTVRTWIVETIVNNPHIRSLRTTVIKLYQKIKWIIDYHQIRINWKSVSIGLYNSYTSLTQRRGYQVKVRMDTWNRVLFTPSEGQIRAEQHLPVPWYSLTQTPRFHRLPEVRTIKRAWSFFSSRRTSIWEKYYQYRPYFSPSLWLPPFPSYAIFASDYFYITLDGVHYAFTGDCVYLLAHDFASENLSLSVDFSSRSKTNPFSLLLIVQGKEVEISSKISVNGKKSELPLVIGDTSITRHGNVVHVSPARGTTLQCHLEYEVCWLWMDGWYFGRTAGLLGRYNNEPNDDVEMPSGNASFLSQWEVGRSMCKSHVNRAPILPSEFESEDECWSYFEDEFSYFKICFPHVDPLPFLSSCRGDFFQGLGLCRTALSYVSACEFQGIPLAMPHECVRCLSYDDSEMTAGDNVTIRAGQLPPSSDVVLIIELRDCNKHYLDKMADLIDSLNQALENNNVTLNRFSIVAFGGNNVYDRPHVRTLDGEIFGSARQFAASWSSFGVPTSVSGVEDAFGALQFSSILPFRIGVSKIFIPLLCAPCARSTTSLVGMDYPEVHRMLIEDGINVHLLLDHDFDIKGTKDFYGLDGKRVYTIKDARALRVTGDAELRHQVQPPKFICVPLALESNGTLFSSKRFNDGRAKRKQFLNVFARRVADSVFEGQDCQQCDCIADQNGSGRVHCQPCHFPTPASDHFNFGFLYDSMEEFKDVEDDDDEIESRNKQNTKIDKY